MVAVKIAAPATCVWIATGWARLRQDPMLSCASSVPIPGGVLAPLEAFVPLGSRARRTHPRLPTRAAAQACVRAQVLQPDRDVSEIQHQDQGDLRQ
jgi:hypothetical protein